MMEYVIKLVGCAVLALLCMAVPMLTVLSFIYRWGAVLASCLAGLSFLIGYCIFLALMNIGQVERKAEDEKDKRY